MILVGKEKQRYRSFKIVKKKTEWLAGRIAAKLALANIIELPFYEIEIQKDENRSPYSFINNVKIDVSITHSNSIALSTAEEKAIDLELIEKRKSSFIEVSFSSAEIEWFKLHRADKKVVTMLWTMKEAHLKRMRIGLKTDLHQVIVDKLNKITDSKFTSIVISPQGKSKCESFVGKTFVVTIANRL